LYAVPAVPIEKATLGLKGRKPVRPVLKTAFAGL